MAKQKEKAIGDIIRSVADQSSDEKEIVEESVQLVIFELDKEEYAVPITDLKEIIRIPEITPIPNSPEFIQGIFNLRGKIVVVVDMEKRFNLIRENNIKSEHIIIAKVEDNIFGVIVDGVTEIIQSPISSIQKAPALISSKIHSDFITGVVILEDGESAKDAEADEPAEKTKRSKRPKIKDNRLIILINLPKMLSEKELSDLAGITREITDKTKE